MGKNIFDDLPLTLSRREPRPARREPRPERSEPQLFPASRVRPIDPPVADAQVASPVGTGGHVPVLSPTPFAPDHLARGKPELPASTLAFLALVGLVAIGVIGASYGIGFSLLSGPARQTVAASGPKSTPLPAPISPDAGTTHVTAAAAAIPVPPAAPQPAVAAATAPPPIKAAQTVPPALPSSASPPPAVPALKPAPIPAASPVAARDAAPPPPSPRKAASHYAAGHPPARHLQPEHARTASREAHFRSARDDASPAPRQTRLARSLTPPPDQSQSFDQLVSQLTRQTQPADQNPPARQALPAGQFQDQTLTPPRPDQPDPFAGR
jgi:hypothetical protein